MTHCQERKKNQHILQSVMQPNVLGHLNRPTFREHGELFCITLSWPIKTESIVRHETYHEIDCNLFLGETCFCRLRTFLRVH